MHPTIRAYLAAGFRNSDEMLEHARLRGEASYLHVYGALVESEMDESAGNITRLLKFNPKVAAHIRSIFGPHDFTAAKLMASVGEYDDGAVSINLPDDFIGGRIPDDQIPMAVNIAAYAIMDEVAFHFAEEPGNAAEKLRDWLKGHQSFAAHINTAPTGQAVFDVMRQAIAMQKKSISQLKVIVPLADGWNWVDLGSCVDGPESAEMQHCGQDGRGNLVSLRDPHNNPHVTMTYNSGRNVVYQIKGKQNTVPVKKYWPAIIAFFQKTHALLEDWWLEVAAAEPPGGDDLDLAGEFLKTLAKSGVGILKKDGAMFEGAPTRPNSTAMVVVPGEPPGKNICGFIRGLVGQRTKVIVAVQQGSLAPGQYERLLRASMPDCEKKLRIMDVGDSISDAVSSAERNRHYSPSQALEVFATKEETDEFTREVQGGSLTFDPTVIMVTASTIPTDDAGAIQQAVQGEDLAAMHRVLDPHVFSDQNALQKYKDAIKGTATEGLVREAIGEFSVAKGDILFHATLSPGFPRFEPRPAWFTPSRTEAQGYASGLHTGRTAILKCQFVGNGKIASKNETARFIAQLTGAEADPDWMFAHFDSNQGVLEADQIEELIESMRRAGFDGAIHPDFDLSIDDDEEQGPTSHSLVIFDPHQTIKVSGVVESLQREFLTDIAPTREIGIHRLNMILRHELGDSFADLEYLGSGRNGSAYRTPDGLILKVTTDKREVDSAAKLKGMECEYIHRIHEVVFTEDPNIWIIVQEGGLEKLPAEYCEEFDVAMQIIETLGAGHALREGDGQSVKEIMLRSEHRDLCLLVAEVMRKFHVGGMMREVAALGLTADFHSGNIMLREGRPVLTDLGTPGDDPGDISESAGNGRIAYHGSHTKIGVLKPIAGSNMGTDFGPGMYFTTSLEDAKYYGHYVYQAELTLNNPFVVGMQMTPGMMKVKNALGVDDEYLPPDTKNPWHTLMGYAKTLVEIGQISWKSLINFMKKMGHDGIVVSNNVIRSAPGGSNIEGDYMIVFDVSQVGQWRASGDDHQVNEFAGGVQAAPQAGPRSHMRGSNSSAWAGGKLVLSKPEQHVPEDENENERTHALDQDIQGGGLNWGSGLSRRGY